ncbi:MAG TPA: AAA family ATPase [Candidatus Nanoarchaeia archaeon]|nr:AAA family ATPase [Candidatus Nanoarchaeia archaeon]
MSYYTEKARKPLALANGCPQKNSDFSDIIIRGPLGCGKSTIAGKLSKILNAKYFAVDRILEEHNLTKNKEAGYISQRSFIEANEIIALRAKRILDSGKLIVFDGNFYWKSQINNLIEKLNFQHHVFTLKAPLKVCIARDAERGKTHGEDAARTIYKKSIEFDYGTVININRSLGECIDDILSYLPKP